MSWNSKFITKVGIGCQEIMDPFQDGRNMKVAIASVLRMAE